MTGLVPFFSQIGAAVRLAPEEIVLLGLAPLAGVSLFLWLLRNSMGKTALDDSAERSNSMPILLPWLLITIWIGYVVGCSAVVEAFTTNLSESQQVFCKFFCIASLEVVMIVLIIVIARRFFTERLKGFGLDLRTLRKDFAYGWLNLLTAWPFVMAALMLVLVIGKAVVGSDFEIAKNESLEVLIEHKSLWLRILVVVFAGVVAPIFEEFLFRGILQTSLSTHYMGKWPSIFVTSILFAALHPSMHFPSLLVLAIFIGYAYEKSGSLLRPIFIHVFFNTISLAVTLIRSYLITRGS